MLAVLTITGALGVASFAVPTAHASLEAPPEHQLLQKDQAGSSWMVAKLTTDGSWFEADVMATLNTSNDRWSNWEGVVGLYDTAGRLLGQQSFAQGVSGDAMARVDVEAISFHQQFAQPTPQGAPIAVMSAACRDAPPCTVGATVEVNSPSALAGCEAGDALHPPQDCALRGTYYVFLGVVSPAIEDSQFSFFGDNGVTLDGSSSGTNAVYWDGTDFAPDVGVMAHDAAAHSVTAALGSSSRSFHVAHTLIGDMFAGNGGENQYRVTGPNVSANCQQGNPANDAAFADGQYDTCLWMSFAAITYTDLLGGSQTFVPGGAGDYTFSRVVEVNPPMGGGNGMHWALFDVELPQ